MGLLTIQEKVKQKEEHVRLLIHGLDNAGKTAILKKFNGKDISTVEPTLNKVGVKRIEGNGQPERSWEANGQSSQLRKSMWRWS